MLTDRFFLFLSLADIAVFDSIKMTTKQVSLPKENAFLSNDDPEIKFILTSQNTGCSAGRETEKLLFCFGS